MLILKRGLKTKNFIWGGLYLNGAFVCYTLERTSKAIPAGFYNLENSISPKFKKELPLVYNNTVPAKRGIRIHAGNSYKDSNGCILVGMQSDVVSFKTKKTELEYNLKESALAVTMVTMLARNNKELIVVDC